MSVFSKGLNISHNRCETVRYSRNRLFIALSGCYDHIIDICDLYVHCVFICSRCTFCHGQAKPPAQFSLRFIAFSLRKCGYMSYSFGCEFTIIFENLHHSYRFLILAGTSAKGRRLPSWRPIMGQHLQNLYRLLIGAQTIFISMYLRSDNIIMWKVRDMSAIWSY